jgi:hypothetical protein
VYRDDFWQAIAAHLKPDGVTIFNVAGKAAALEAPRRTFAHGRTWRSEPNVFGAFWN